MRPSTRPLRIRGPQHPGPLVAPHRQLAGRASARAETITHVTNDGRATRATLGALAAAFLVALSGCGSAAVPADPVEQPTGRPTLYAVGTPASDGDKDFVDGANDPDSAETPTYADERSEPVDRATAGFLVASLTRGYPDKDDRAYLRRVRQLTTSDGLERQQRLDRDRDGAQTSSELYEQHLRTTAVVVSVRSSVSGSDRARAKVEYQVFTQRDDDGTWRTVATGKQRTTTLALVHQGGSGWLVSSIS